MALERKWPSEHGHVLRWAWLRGRLQGKAGSWGVEVRSKVSRGQAKEGLAGPCWVWVLC